MYSGQSRKKDSYRRDITASLTGTSLCTYAIEPPCTERYARWCERSGLFRPLLLDWIILKCCHFVVTGQFFADTRFEKCRNTLCISNFSNRRIGEKYPAKAEEELCGVALYHGASSSPPVDSVGASVGGSVGSGSVGFSVGLSVGLSVGSVGASVGGSVSSTSLATRRLRQS